MSGAQQAPAVRARLFVAGGSPSSERALSNWQQSVRTVGTDSLQFEVIDVLRAPHEALANRILATPTLIIEGASASYRLFGTLDELGELNALLRSCAGKDRIEG